jgi:hypothetical protein
MRPARRPAPQDVERRKALDPKAVDALLDAAGAHYLAGRIDEAARAYGQVETLDSRDVRARYSLAVIDIRCGRFAAARTRLQDVARRHPDHFAARHNLGVAFQALGRWRQAAGAYAAALALRGDSYETALLLANALSVEGRIRKAIEIYRSLAADPAARTRALTRLAILAPDAVAYGELERLREEAGAAHGEAACSLQFALGGVLEARGDFATAFEAFAAGASLKRQLLAAGDPASRPAAVEREHERSATHVKQTFTSDFISRHQVEGDPGPTPIFIVGFPRCGSSLVEQILASHPDVQGMGECSALSSAVDGRFPYAAQAAPVPDHFRRLAGDYLAALRVRGWRPRSHPVDKTLENHLHVGLIALMFPRATILHCLRDPADTSVAAFRQLFASGNETLYDLGAIGRSYVRYRTVMDHWNAVLPGRVTEVNYEALVAGPEKTIPWLVTLACGLPWSPRCLRFHETRRAIATASAAQVRHPIHRSSQARWRRYEDHLGPLFDALGPYAPPRNLEETS